jgi:hypothetical protein
MDFFKKQINKRFRQVLGTFLATSQFSSPIEMGAPRRTTLSTSPAVEVSIICRFYKPNDINFQYNHTAKIPDYHCPL